MSSLTKTCFVISKWIYREKLPRSKTYGRKRPVPVNFPWFRGSSIPCSDPAAGSHWFLPIPVSDMNLWIRSPFPSRISTKFPAEYQVTRIRIVGLPFLIRFPSKVPVLYHGSRIQVIFQSVSCSFLKPRSGRTECTGHDQIWQPDTAGYNHVHAGTGSNGSHGIDNLQPNN